MLEPARRSRVLLSGIRCHDFREKRLPVFAAKVGFSMTTFTQSNTVLRNGIFFAVVDVVNFVAMSLADSARVIVALSNASLERLVERGGMWLERLTAKPNRMVFANHILTTASAGAEFSSFRSSVHEEFLTAINTDPCSAFVSCFVRANLRAVLAAKERTAKLFAARRAGNGLSAAFINRIVFANDVLRSPHPIAFTGTTKAFREMTWFYVKGLFTDRASFIHIGLKGASRSAGQYCCLGNTG